MAFDGSEGGSITVQQGAQLTSKYRQKFPNYIKGRFFGKDILEDILEQEGCMGIRMYFGWDQTNGKMELVLVGADADEDDMLDLVADLSIPCPNICGSSNALNS